MPARQHSPESYPKPTKRYASNETKSDQNSAQDDDIHEQIRKIVLLVEQCVLVPCDICVVIHRAKQRSRVARRQRPCSNRQQRPTAFVKEWRNIGCCVRGTTLRRMRGIEPSHVFSCNLRSWI